MQGASPPPSSSKVGATLILCFGDTGPDEVQKTSNMQDIWKAIADKVKQRKLKAIILETSYTNDRPDDLLFGHLTPKWVHKTLHVRDQEAGGNALKGLPVVVSHIKYSLTDEQLQKRRRPLIRLRGRLAAHHVID